MRSSIVALAACSALFFPSAVRADEPRTAYNLGAGVIYPMTPEGKGLPPTALHSFIAVVPLNDSAGVVLKAGMASPLTVFTPAPQLQLGPIFRVSDRLRLGATAIYRYTPHWPGTANASHLVGGSLAPSFILPSGIAVALPFAAARNLTTKTTVVALSFELVLPLGI